jgi:hypothetical protein
MPVMPPSHHPDTFRSPGDARTAWRPSQSAQRPHVGCFQSRVVGLGPQVGYLFPIGELQGYEAPFRVA